MTMNVSLPGIAAAQGVERSAITEGAGRRKAGMGAEVEVQISSMQQVQTIRELKVAAMQGEPLSVADEQVMRMVEKAIKAVEGTPTALDISVHQKTNHIMVKVLNKETGELIRELPPEKSLDFLANILERSGILLDEKR